MLAGLFEANLKKKIPLFSRLAIFVRIVTYLLLALFFC